MATINEVMELLTSTFSDATMVRTNKTNCLAIPTDIIENGMPKYIKVQLGSFATKATKTHEAFDFDTARADYEQWAKEAAERANKPKGDNSKKTESAERTRVRTDKIRAYIAANDIENATATDVCNAVFADDPDTKPMMVGTILNKMVEAGMLDVETVKGKKTYTKA